MHVAYRNHLPRPSYRVDISALPELCLVGGQCIGDMGIPFGYRKGFADIAPFHGGYVLRVAQHLRSDCPLVGGSKAEMPARLGLGVAGDEVQPPRFCGYAGCIAQKGRVALGKDRICYRLPDPETVDVLRLPVGLLRKPHLEHAPPHRGFIIHLDECRPSGAVRHRNLQRPVFRGRRRDAEG